MKKPAAQHHSHKNLDANDANQRSKLTEFGDAESSLSVGGKGEGEGVVMRGEWI